MEMNALDSPLEALAINYLSYGVLTAINNVWALIAVFTAAVSFWKIRANSVSVSVPGIADQPHSTFLPPPSKRCSISQPPNPLPSAAVVDEVPSSSGTTLVQRPESGNVECNNEGPTRGEFTVYYGGDEEVVEEKSVGDDYDEVDGETWRCEDGWEAVLRMKTEKLGWYRYQDLTVFDGSVVRLWDGCGRRNGYGISGNVW